MLEEEVESDQNYHSEAVSSGDDIDDELPHALTKTLDEFSKLCRRCHRPDRKANLGSILLDLILTLKYILAVKDICKVIIIVLASQHFLTKCAALDAILIYSDKLPSAALNVIVALTSVPKRKHFWMGRVIYWI